jgi:hypothetical protein
MYLIKSNDPPPAPGKASAAAGRSTAGKPGSAMMDNTAPLGCRLARWRARWRIA